ncbi:hypothetical protein P8452_50770 [Trifolium repens]|nr:hypothetical protein P8452_50770 [Trifolium repens]
MIFLSIDVYKPTEIQCKSVGDCPPANRRFVWQCNEIFCEYRFVSVTDDSLRQKKKDAMVSKATTVLIFSSHMR